MAWDDVDEEDPEQLAAASPLYFLFDKALRGDGEALGHFFTLVRTVHFRPLVNRLKKSVYGVHTDTIEDVFHDTLISLMAKLESGELKNLEEERRKDVLKYLEGLCHGRLRDEVRPRKSPVLQRHKAPLHEGIPDRAARIPGEQRHTEHIALLDAAMALLEPGHARILQMYRDCIPYSEIARVTGKNEETLRNLVAKLKKDLARDIRSRSDTAQINFERKERQSIQVAPSWEEMLAEIRLLHRDTQAAVRFVHLEHHTVDELARTLGERGPEKARARLERAYNLLSIELDYPFPEAFREIKPGSQRKSPSRVQEIEAAVARLPAMNRDAFVFVCMEGHSVQEFGKKPEVGGLLEAQEWLEDACRLLSAQFNDIFPDAYERARKK